MAALKLPDIPLDETAVLMEGRHRLHFLIDLVARVELLAKVQVVVIRFRNIELAAGRAVARGLEEIHRRVHVASAAPLAAFFIAKLRREIDFDGKPLSSVEKGPLRSDAEDGVFCLGSCRKEKENGYNGKK